MEGCGSVHLTNRSRSGRPENLRIRNTASICLGTFSLRRMCEYVVSRLDNTEHKQVVDQRNTFAWAAEFVYRGTWSLTTKRICAYAKTSSCVSLLLNSVHIYLKIPDKSYSMKCYWNWVTLLQDVLSVTTWPESEWVRKRRWKTCWGVNTEHNQRQISVQRHAAKANQGNAIHAFTGCSISDDGYSTVPKNIII
jgi:hypothetical protein